MTLDASECNLENTFRFYFRDNLGSGRNAGKKRNEEGSSHVSLEAGSKPTIDPSHNQRKNAARRPSGFPCSFLASSPQQKSNPIVRFYPAKDELYFSRFSATLFHSGASESKPAQFAVLRATGFQMRFVEAERVECSTPRHRLAQFALAHRIEITGVEAGDGEVQEE